MIGPPSEIELTAGEFLEVVGEIRTDDVLGLVTESTPPLVSLAVVLVVIVLLLVGA